MSSATLHSRAWSCETLQKGSAACSAMSKAEIKGASIQTTLEVGTWGSSRGAQGTTVHIYTNLYVYKTK